MTGSVICHSCGRKFKRVGTHWSRSECDYPTPSEKEDEILSGIFLGDGSLAAHDSENAYMRWNNVNKEFMESIHSKLKPLTTGVKLSKTAEESYSYNHQRSDRDWPANVDDYNDIFLTRTRRLPYFRKFKDWYQNGRKRIPDTLELTPTIAKYWYVSDGAVNWMRDYSAKIQFASRNKADRERFIIDLFEQAGFTVKRNRHMYYFSVDESKSILNWMGDPPSGFDYKWEVESRETYKHKKKQAYSNS